MPQISTQLRQAYELQDFAYDLLKRLRESLNGHAITREDAATFCQLQKAWQGCQERISFHRRVPSPGSLKQPMAMGKRKRRRVLPPPPAANSQASTPAAPATSPPASTPASPPASTSENGYVPPT